MGIIIIEELSFGDPNGTRNNNSTSLVQSTTNQRFKTGSSFTSADSLPSVRLPCACTQCHTCTPQLWYRRCQWPATTTNTSNARLPCKHNLRLIHLCRFPAMQRARSSHARAQMHAADVVAVVPPPLLSLAAFNLKKFRAPSCPNSGRGGSGGLVTNPEARAS